jgi:hypothetical protein
VSQPVDGATAARTLSRRNVLGGAAGAAAATIAGTTWAEARGVPAI